VNLDLNFEKTELTQKLESFNSDHGKAYREHRNSLQSTQNSAQPTDEADIEELEYMRKINLEVTINSVKLELRALEVKLNEATVAMDNVKHLNLTENYRGEKLNELKAKKDFLIKQKDDFPSTCKPARPSIHYIPNKRSNTYKILIGNNSIL